MKTYPSNQNTKMSSNKDFRQNLISLNTPKWQITSCKTTGFGT